MNRVAQVQPFATARAGVGIFNPALPEANTGRWKINGYRACIIIWTAEEWESLTVRPPDARYYPCGVWCALRME